MCLFGFDDEDHRCILVFTDRLANNIYKPRIVERNMFITQGICESHSRRYGKSVGENVGEAEWEKLDISIS